VNILEEKMNELKELIKESDKRIAILKKYQDKKLDSKYQVISLLLELGYDIEEITKVLNLSFQEKDLLIEIYKRKKL
jgi:DNA-binding transcriptional MerR regulator